MTDRLSPDQQRAEKAEQERDALARRIEAVRAYCERVLPTEPLVVRSLARGILDLLNGEADE